MKLSPSMQTLLARVDLSLLYPPFAELWVAAIAKAHDRGHDFFGISGFRNPLEQATLFAKGRAADGEGHLVVVDPKLVVTNAEPWTSTHNYGIGGDACRDADQERAGLQPDWKIEDYQVYAECCNEVGLEAGFFWKKFKEGPHAQLPLRSHNITTAQLKSLYEIGGLPRVWKFLDGFTWR